MPTIEFLVIWWSCGRPHQEESQEAQIRKGRSPGREELQLLSGGALSQRQRDGDRLDPGHSRESRPPGGAVSK